MSNEVTVIENEVVSTQAETGGNLATPFDMPVKAFKQTLDNREKTRKALIAHIQKALVDGIDYGSVPTKRGLSKPSLRKPGAEKICGMLGVTVAFPNSNLYEESAAQGAKISSVILRCQLQDSCGRTLAEGIGARDLGKDYGDLNKTLKMAAKSAHIDATLRLAGLSEVFTQDLEDLARETQERIEPAQKQAPAQQAAPKFEGIGESWRRRIEATIQNYGLDRARVKNWVKAKWNIDHFADLTKQQASELIKQIETVFPAKTGDSARILFEACKAEGCPYPVVVKYARDTYKKRPDELEQSEYEEIRLFIQDEAKRMKAQLEASRRAQSSGIDTGEAYDAVLDSREPGYKGYRGW